MIPDTISADYILSNLTDQGLAKHLLHNYADILDKAGPSDVPSYCTAISNILGIHSGCPDNENLKEEYLRSALMYNIREIMLTTELAEKESKIPSTPA